MKSKNKPKPKPKPKSKHEHEGRGMLTQQLVDIVDSISTGNVLAAREAVFPLLEAHYDDYRVWHLAGLIASQSGNQEQATIYLKQTHQLAPEQVEPLLNLARVYVRQQKFNLSASCYLKVLAIDAYNIPALYELSTLLFKTGKYDAAISYLNKWLKQEENIKAYKLLAQCYIANEDLERAAQSYNNAINFQSDNIDILIEFAGLYILSKNYQKAITLYERALALDERYDIKQQLATAYYLNLMYDKAISIYRQLLKVQPKNIEILNNFSCVYKDAGELTEAKKLLQQIIEKGQGNAQIYANLGNVQIAQKAYKLAEEAYLKAIELSTQPKFIMQRYAIELLKASQYKKAWPWFTKGFSCVDMIKLARPRWNTVTKQDVPLLIVDGQVNDIIQFARFIPIVLKQVKSIYLYHPDAQIREWLGMHFPAVNLLAELNSLPSAVTHYSSFMALPEVFYLVKQEIIRKTAYLITEKMATNKNSILVALGSTRLKNSHYQYWLNQLAQNYQVTIFSPNSLQVFESQIAQIFSQNLIEITNQISTFQTVISDNSLINFLAGALAKPNIALLATPHDWYWSPKLRKHWNHFSQSVILLDDEQTIKQCTKLLKEHAD